MKYLNIGCGYHFSNNEQWVNLDFISTGKNVIAHNLIKGIPFENNSFDLVYHSHVLEHFSKEEGEKLISECFRVLKQGGVLRISVPDLEKIARNYLKFLEEGLNSPDHEGITANYNWMLLEMYDQTVRNSNGGNMAKYLFQDTITNENFVMERLGEEGKSLRNFFLQSKKNISPEHNAKSESMLGRMKNYIKKYVFKKLKVDEQALSIGKFRLGGEIHQWMYDRYSLSTLLKNNGGMNIIVRDAFTSYDLTWKSHNLDQINGLVRKPDSLFMEAIK